MANKVTIKVVSQICNLRYDGVARQTKSAAASRMAKLLGATDRAGANPAKPSMDSSRSFTLHENSMSGNTDPNQIGAVTFVFDKALALFGSYAQQEAVTRRKEFFSAVEAGKKSLVEKYGERIPNSAIAELSANLRSKSCVVWKHQIVTTRTSDSQFEGSRLNRNGTWTATVKSKTIYTMVALTEAQLNELKAVLTAEKDITGNVAGRESYELNGYSYVWRGKTSGSILFKEKPIGSPSTGG